MYAEVVAPFQNFEDKLLHDAETLRNLEKKKKKKKETGKRREDKSQATFHRQSSRRDH